MTSMLGRARWAGAIVVGVLAGCGDLALPTPEAAVVAPAPEPPPLPAWEISSQEDRVYGTPTITARLAAAEEVSNLVGLPVRPVLEITCRQRKTSLTIEVGANVQPSLDLVTLNETQVPSIPVAMRIGDTPVLETRAAVGGDNKSFHVVQEPVTAIWRMRNATRLVAQWPMALQEEPVQVEWRWTDLPFLDSMDDACEWQLARFFDGLDYSEIARADERKRMQDDIAGGTYTDAQLTEYLGLLRHFTEAEIAQFARAGLAGDKALTEELMARAKSRRDVVGAP